MLIFSKKKFVKNRKGILCGIENKTNCLIFGDYGIKSLTSARIKSYQIEALRKFLMRSIRRTDKFWLRFFGFISITKKPIETRMGKGKGNVVSYFFPLKAGRILIEFYCISTKLALKINSSLKSKLPVKIKLVKYYDM